MWLLLAFVLVPMIEIALFIQVGGAIGLWPTLGLVVLTAIVGTLLVRSQGFMTMRRLQNVMTEGTNPLDPVLHGLMIVVGAVMLLTPGFFTDAVGLSLMIPPVRTWVLRQISKRAEVRMAGHRPPADEPLDADYTVLDETGTPGNSGWTRPPEK